MISNKRLSEIDMNMIPKKIRDEIMKLPDNIKDMIIINRDIERLTESNFSKAIESEEIHKMEQKLLSNVCETEDSLYDLSTETEIDGYVVRVIPKGANIYKTFQGFITEEDLRKFSESNLDRPSWLGYKHLCYAIARSDWGSIVSFKVLEPIYLIDYFNEKNLNKMLKLFESLPDSTYGKYGKKRFIDTFKYASGYAVSLSNQILHLVNNYKWKEIWLYTEDFNKGFEYNYCKSPILSYVTPLGALTNAHANDLVLFDQILKKYVKIDGLIRRTVSSKLDIGGKYYIEELLIKNKVILNKMKFDNKDPLCWVNWKIKGLKDYSGIHIRYSVAKFTDTNRLCPNENFALIKFYTNNRLEDLELQKKRYILSYNVHNFNSLNSDVTYEDNVVNILKLINNNMKKIKIIVLQETTFKNKEQYNLFLKRINRAYKYIYTGENGSSKYDIGLTSPKILVASKKNYENKIIQNIQLKEDEYIEIIKKIKKEAIDDYDCDKIKYNMDRYLIDEVSQQSDQQSINKCDLFINRLKIDHLSKVPRSIIFLEDTEYGKIVFVHLEIGIRNYPHKFEIENKIIDKVNSMIRVQMIDKILVHNPDIIIGDFNFTLDDNETEYLISKNYHPQERTTLNSTPYNRVDHCFIKGENKTDNKLLRCNYSDHLPMFQSIKKIN